jgi:hypothetical protein
MYFLISSLTQAVCAYVVYDYTKSHLMGIAVFAGLASVNSAIFHATEAISKKVSEAFTLKK